MRPIALFTAGGASLAMARHIPMSPPVVTAAPDPDLVDLRLRQAASNPPPNLFSLAQVLLTVFPASFFEIAATNPAAISTILWSEFLDGQFPAWFENLPADIRSYLVEAYLGLKTTPNSACTASCSSIVSVSASQTHSSSYSTPTVQSSATQPRSSGFSTATSSGGSSTRSSATKTSSPVSGSTHHSSASSTITSSFSSTDSLVATSTKFATTTLSSPSNLPPPAAEPSEPTSQSANTGLSRASKIGVGVGVPLGALAIAALFLLCCLRRRRNRHVHEKEEPYSDATPFVAPASFYGDTPGTGPYGAYRPYGPYTQIPDENPGFQDTPVAGGAAAGQPRSQAPNDTDPFPDSHYDATAPADPWETAQHPMNAGAAGYTNLRSLPNRRRRRGSASSLRSIEEEADEDGDLANIGVATTYDGGENEDSHMVSPVHASHDPMDPPYPRDTAEDVAHQQYTAFRSGSLKRNRSRSSTALPTEDLPPINTNIFSDPAQNSSSSSEHLERRRSRSIGGGYRSLPSPHLQSPSQTQPYLLPRGEWLEDGEDLPPSATMNRNMF